MENVVQQSSSVVIVASYLRTFFLKIPAASDLSQSLRVFAVAKKGNRLRNNLKY